MGHDQLENDPPKNNWNEINIFITTFVRKKRIVNTPMTAINSIKKVFCVMSVSS